MPGACARGMRLQGAWQNPPGLAPGQEYEELPVTLYYLWMVEDEKSWWAMRLSRNADGSDQRFEKHAWWKESDGMSLSRKRTFLTRQQEQD